MKQYPDDKDVQAYLEYLESFMPENAELVLDIR